ncbi:CMGC family protein kinase [Trichomonas vaginalis G3]|uniref:CMGC family protein kinase n=1 Tax=Trichomonas vaginalis (strain ATCC PRA-98 / G3) TaxID=412133 RepID=A2DQW6_TRIV3|nr:protein kinase protein [Trichomonas vaginalis G3]EAY17233.1 CMGC family protein kinase [Trichomonas vaginalis G3]KAI5486235.1 protein kinase protein [Trichomonas vaginalis G3]|eukprot:XP_001329456.1 CMGC family protein kinase [Trichomonas vaginalis G3]
MSYFVSPPEPYREGAAENINGSLLISLHEVMQTEKANYMVQDIIGSGGFSEVYKVIDVETQQVYAIKIYKHLPDHSQIDRQAEREIMVLTEFNTFNNGTELNTIGTMIDWFEYKRHKVILMNFYPFSLLQLIQMRGLGFPISLVQQVAREISQAIKLLHRKNYIHGDIKPENIVIDTNNQPKLIDFGSTLISGDPDFFYIQSRFYRAPEIILQLGCSQKIDIWSFGCLLAELYLGWPLFPGTTTLQMLQMIEFTVGKFPKSIVDQVRQFDTTYFDDNGNINRYQFPSNLYTLEYLVMNYFCAENNDEHSIEIDRRRKSIFLDLLRNLLKIDPRQRYTIDQIIHHPFLHENMV